MVNRSTLCWKNGHCGTWLRVSDFSLSTGLSLWWFLYIYISNTFKKIISIKHIAIKSTCINPVSLIFSTDFVFQTISVTFFAIWLTKPFSVRPIPINLCPSSLNISHQPRCILLFSVKFISVKFIYPTCFSMHISLQLSKIKEKHRTKPLITETAFLKGA